MSSRSTTAEPPRRLPEAVVVARVRRPHGLRGEVLVEVLSDNTERFAAGSVLRLAASGGRRRRVRLAASRPHRLGRVIRLEGCESRDEAELLRDAVLEIDRAEVPPAPAGSYYFYELEGCSCRDRRCGELGRVTELVEDGGGLLLRVEGQRGVLLLPFVAGYVVSVDPRLGAIELDLPPGLVETCASPS